LPGSGNHVIAKETGRIRQTVYDIKDDTAGAEAAVVACAM
jgi:hypothetical protein